MTPEDLNQLHDEALKRGADPKKLEKLRREALAECGSVEAMARWADFNDRLDRYWRSLRPPHMRS